MAKKLARETPHLRIRIEPKLLAKLEKSREKNGHTLTGEIVTRLEQSFQTDDRIARTQDFMLQRANDYKERYDEKLDVMREQMEEAQATAEKAIKDLEQQRAEFQLLERHREEAIRSAAVVDVLLGRNKLKSAFLRSIALELAEVAEDWVANESNRRQLADRLVAKLKEQQAGVAEQ
jgi:hypothetical protein